MSDNKQVTSVSLDADVVRRAKSRDHVNLSGLCNDLLSEYFSTGNSAKARLEARRQRLEHQKEHLETELRQIDNELDDVKTQLAEIAEQEQATVEQLEQLADTLPDDLDPDNLAVQTQAGKLDLKPVKLVERIEEIRGQNGQTPAVDG